MKPVTLCFPVTFNCVWLAPKLKSHGAGYYNGYGGKIDEGESPKSAAIRELYEESGLVAEESGLQQRAHIIFSFDGVPRFECFVYLLRVWDGVPKATTEMGEPELFLIENLPKKMWPADMEWLPKVLSGKMVVAKVNNPDGNYEYKEL
jgi:8-oxo-dGTP diphosphatase